MCKGLEGKRSVHAQESPFPKRKSPLSLSPTPWAKKEKQALKKDVVGLESHTGSHSDASETHCMTLGR